MKQQMATCIQKKYVLSIVELAVLFSRALKSVMHVAAWLTVVVRVKLHTHTYIDFS